MAGVGIVGTTDSSVEVYLISLDTTWGGATRTCKWYISANGYPTQNSYKDYKTAYIYGSPSSGGAVTFTGLEADTNYYVRCYVYKGSELLATISGQVYTDEAISWTRTTHSLGTISSLYSHSTSLSRYQMRMYSVKFSTSGKAYFYTEGNSVDVIGYLGTSSGWSSADGEPTSYKKYDDDSNGMPNFLISYDVTAGTQYYLWVRSIGGTQTGTVTVYIEPPEAAPTWTLSSSNYGTLSADKTQNITMGSYTLYCRSVKFATSGTATFYTTGGVDTKGYLSTTSTWDNTSGTPSPYVAYNDDGSDTNFSFTYDVTAGTQDYLWVRGYSDTPSGTITVHIEVPQAVTVSKWIWSASNGSASASATSKAYTAVSSQGVVTNFSYLVWNDMVNKVVEILTALGDSWDASYLSLANTKMASSDKVLTAVRYNSLRYNVGSHYSTGISDKATGEIVYGGYLTTLTDCMNSWIDRDL